MANKKVPKEEKLAKKEKKVKSKDNDKKLKKVETEVEGRTTAETKMKSSNEIDDLFASKRRPAPEEKKAEEKIKTAIPQAVADEDDWMDTKGERKKRRPTTAEGYPIYTDREMKIGQGGGTPDCPFDCDCCF